MNDAALSATAAGPSLRAGEHPPTQLIPPSATVRDRLLAVCREARLLRRLLQLSREADAGATEGEVARG